MSRETDRDVPRPAGTLGDDGTPMKQGTPSVLEQLARKALDLGADTLEVEYRDGHDEVVAYMGAFGREIASSPSNSRESTTLRRDLYDCSRRPRRFSIKGRVWTIRAEVYENFGEDAFRVELGQSNNRMQRTRSAPARNRGPRR